MKPTEKEMHTITVIAGLGNPGDEYKNTYHNIGLLALDFLQKGGSPETRKMRTVHSVFEYSKNGSIAWVKPLVFMNESGIAISQAVHFLKAEPSALLIIHDDSDLYVGDFKISFGSGSAGHHGVESIINHLGTKDFFRVRIGIRPRENEQENRAKASEMVLRKIPREKETELVKTFARIKDALSEKGLLIQTETD